MVYGARHFVRQRYRNFYYVISIYILLTVLLVQVYLSVPAAGLVGSLQTHHVRLSYLNIVANVRLRSSH